MKIAIAVACVITCFNAFAAEDNAVAEANYDVSSNISKFETKDAGDRFKATIFGFGVSATIPISQYFGATLSTVAGRTNLKDSLIDCNVNALQGSADVFARSANLGSIGVSYANTPSVYCSAYSKEQGVKRNDVYDLHGEYYFQDITLAANTTLTRGENRNELHAWGTAANYYLDKNSKIVLRTGKGPYIGLAYHLQPRIFDNKVIASISFTHQQKRNSSPEFNTISLYTSYYFGSNVDMLTRDRKY